MAFRETGTKATWANPTTIPISQRQNGGWYFNPATGSVDRWWSDTPTATPVSSPTAPINSGGSTSDYQSILTSQTAARQAENARLKSEQEGVLGAYQGAISGQEPLTTAQTRISGELGIPGLTTQLGTARGEVANVKSLLTQLEGDINARTSGQLLTESQRRRLLASEETPLRTQLSGLLAGQEVAGGQLSDAYTQLGQQLTALTAEQKRMLQPYEARINAFSERAARESTGYSNDQQNSLTLLLEKIKRDQTLSDREWQQASDAAVLERTFEQTKETMRLQSSLDIAKANATGTGTPQLTPDEIQFISGAGGTAGSSATLNKGADIWGGFGSTLDNIFGAFVNSPINFGF